MKIKITSKKIFILTICFQLVIFCTILTKNILIKHSAVKNNRIYTFDCTYYDPYNILKGRYVQLYINQRTCSFSDLDEESFENGTLDYLFPNQMVYVMLKPEENGFWSIYGVRQKKPKDGDFIKVKFLYRMNDNKCFFDFLCDEYYMQENYAEYVDTLRNQKEVPMKFEIFSDTKGNILQKQLYFFENDVNIPVEEYIENRISLTN